MSVWGSTGSLWGGICQYLVVLGQYRTELADTWWYLVSIGRYWLAVGGTGSVLGGSGWYLVILGQYNSVLLIIKLYRVSKVLVCPYILEKVEIWLSVTDPSQTHRQQNIGLLSLYKV